MAAMGQSGVWAVTVNPEGAAVIRSVWLIQQVVSFGTSVNKGESPRSMYRTVPPYSEVMAGATCPPRTWAMSWAP